MYDFKNMDKRKLIFANIFLLSNRLQTILDYEMEGITTKQWLTFIMLGMFDEPPTLGEFAYACDSSYQNTKQIAIKLEKKGYILIKKDPKDSRMLRICITPQAELLAFEYNRKGDMFLDEMFSVLTEEELSLMSTIQLKLYSKLMVLKKQIEREATR